jgi:hypothetical protein
MKICPETARLTALREGWLDQEDTRRLREHLEVCPTCRSARVDLDALLEVIEELPRGVEPPPGGWDALLEATVKMRDRIIPLPAPSRSRWRRMSIAAAAALLIAGSAITLLPDRTPPPTVTAESAVENEFPESLLEEHARASDLVPFSDGTTLLILANSGRR